MRQVFMLVVDRARAMDRRVSSLVARDAVRVFEIQLLAFPVFVVLLASLSLLCGGRCALWQWWAAIGLAVLLGKVYRFGYRSFACGTGLFFLLIFLLWITGGISIVPLGDDPLRYHLPGIRLLTEGWNPVWQGRWDLITSSFGIDPSETKTLFVLPNAKSVWYLDAVAYFFIRNPFNMMFPAYFLLVVVSGITILRNFPTTSFFVRFMMVLAVIGIVPPCWNSIDAVVGLSGACLLTAMHKCIARGDWDWFELLGYSFWMCTAKQTSLLHCFLFWLVFSMVMLYRCQRRVFPRLLAIAFGMIAVIAVVGASPYFSSWKEFGHPLYPKCTVDESKFPSRNMVSCDFLTRNDDAAAMGRVGAYVYSYISPEVARFYYRHKLHKKVFSPWCFCLSYPELSIRFAFCGCLFLMVLLGRKEDRFVVVCIVLGTMAMPTEMIGYIRYCPWCLAGALFVMPLLAECSRAYHLKYVLLAALMWKTSIRPGVSLVQDAARHVERAHSGMQYLVSTPPKHIFNGFNEQEYDKKSQEYFDLFFTEKNTRKRGDDVNKTSLANVKLLVRQVAFLSDSLIVDLTDNNEESVRFRESNGMWKSFYDNSFKVSPDNPLPEACSCSKTLYCSFPRLLFKRVSGSFNWN